LLSSFDGPATDSCRDTLVSTWRCRRCASVGRRPGTQPLTVRKCAHDARASADHAQDVLQRLSVRTRRQCSPGRRRMQTSPQWSAPRASKYGLGLRAKDIAAQEFDLGVAALGAIHDTLRQFTDIVALRSGRLLVRTRPARKLRSPALISGMTSRLAPRITTF
jgi:hypothetical protein